MPPGLLGEPPLWPRDGRRGTVACPTDGRLHQHDMVILIQTPARQERQIPRTADGSRGNSIHSMSKIVPRLLLVLLILTSSMLRWGGFHVR